MKSLAEICMDVLSLESARDAIEYEDRWYSWGELRQLAEQIWSALEVSGIGEGAPVTLVPRNRPSALTAFVALLAQGRTLRMVYAFQSPTAIAGAVERLNSPAVVMAEQDFTAEVRAVLAAKGIAGIAIGEMSAKLVEGFERGTPRPENDSEMEPRVEILTSGTTGPPKQFPLPHAVIARIVAGHNTAGVFREDPTEPPVPFTFPVGNISGIYSSAASILRGKRTIMLDRFSVTTWHQFVLKYRPTAGGAPPAAVNMILDANIPKEDLASFKYFSTGAAPLDPTVHRAFEDRYGIPILLSYGATEFGGPVVAMTPELHAEWGDKKLGSVGKPMPGAKLRILDPETEKELPAGKEGVMEVVSPRMGPGWIRTSDIGVIDADGFVWHRGRADGAIMRGGFKVLPETIERALLLHPAVSAAGVVGVADKRLYQVPAAAIQLKPDAVAPSIEELERHLRQYVLSTHIPVHWEFVDALPKNRSFKIDRPGLQLLFEEESVG